MLFASLATDQEVIARLGWTTWTYIPLCLLFGMALTYLVVLLAPQLQALHGRHSQYLGSPYFLARYRSLSVHLLGMLWLLTWRIHGDWWAALAPVVLAEAAIYWINVHD